jgi:hypothetical protein
MPRTNTFAMKVLILSRIVPFSLKVVQLESIACWTPNS